MPVLELEGSPELMGNPRALEGTLVIGSGAQATWRIPDRDLAARHFTLRAEGGDATVAPATTQSVIAVNGRQVGVGGAPVRTGDVIAAGSARFVYLAEARAVHAVRVGDSAGERAYLVDGARRRAYELGRRVVQIGREVGCSIVLRDPAVSRFHADMRTEAGGHVLYSMGSSGSTVNGAAVTNPRMLSDGDVVQMGSTAFTYTRGPLPAGIALAPYEDRAPDIASRRATVVHQQAIASGQARPRSSAWRAVAALALVAGMLVLLAIVLPR